MYDILIIGTGPAAVSAALTARQRDRSAVLVGNDHRENPLARSPLVPNYPGLTGSGLELLEAMHRQLREAEIPVVNKRVLQAAAVGGAFACTAGQDFYEGRSLLLCTGQARTRQIDGEAQYLGRGVSYCATCDGMLYRGKRAAVLGEGGEAVEDGNFLLRLGCEVMFFGRGKRPEGLDGAVAYTQGKDFRVVGAGEQENPSEGAAGLLGLSADSVLFPADVVFILRPTVAAENLFRGIQTRDGFLVTDRSMATSVPGVFAAGDCVGKPYQLAKAVGEGNLAALSADQWLTQRKGEQ